MTMTQCPASHPSTGEQSPAGTGGQGSSSLLLPVGPSSRVHLCSVQPLSLLPAPSLKSLGKENGPERHK